MRVFTPEGLEPADLPLEDHVEVVRMLPFSFDGRSLTPQSWPLAVGVDAASWVSAVLVVLVHQINAWATGARLFITVDAIELDPDDPKQIFGSSQLAAISLDSSNAPGTARIESLTPPWGKSLRVVLKFQQGVPEATAEQQCTLTIKLVGRREGIVQLAMPARSPA
jgi:hypothetical protein